MIIWWIINWSKCRMPHWRAFRNFTHQAGAIWGLSKHELFGIIPDPGSQKSVILSVESISTIPFQAGAGYFKIPEWGKHCSISGMLCLVSILRAFRGTGVQPKKNPSTLSRCAVNIISNNTNREIQRLDMLVAQTSDQLGLLRCTNNWHNRRFGRTLILLIPPPMASVHLPLYLANFRLCKERQCKIEVWVKWELR